MKKHLLFLLSLLLAVSTSFAQTKYTVKWSVLGTTTSVQFESGSALVLPENPDPCSSSQVFAGWTASSEDDFPDLNGVAPADLFTTAGGKTVTKNITYLAVFAFDMSGTLSNYTPYCERKIQFNDENGSLLQLCDVEDGIWPIYSESTPHKDGYVFAGWTPELDLVSGDAVYTATYEPAPTTADLLRGAFSVANGKKVRFAKSNIQYNLGSGKWSFGNAQYDLIGLPNVYLGTPGFEETVDMFGWSNGTDNNYGVNPSNKKEDYTGDFVDWGGLFGAGWYTLSSADWQALINRDGGNKWANAMVVGRKGVIFLPDDWQLPEGISFVPKYTTQSNIEVDKYESNVYNYAQWQQMEAAGAIFLPLAGRRTGGYGNHIGRQNVESPYVNGLTGYYSWMDNVEQFGYYWTSTRKNEQIINYLILGGYKEGVEDDPTNEIPQIWTETGRYGQSVRLVKEALYDITWQNDNGTVLETDLAVPYGATPEYNGETPTKAATAEYTYTFDTWIPAIAPVADDDVYTATYTATPNPYHVTYMVDGVQYGAIDEIAYGKTLTPREAPVAPAGKVFSGWIDLPETMPAHDVVVTGSMLDEYTVTWKVVDVSSVQAKFGDGMSLVLPAVDPTPCNASMTFAGWSAMDEDAFMYELLGTKPADLFTEAGDIKVTQDITYRAVFMLKDGDYTKYTLYCEYKVAFVDDDNTMLQFGGACEGERPKFEQPIPSKPGKAFAGWSPAISLVTGDATYKATYTDSEMKDNELKGHFSVSADKIVHFGKGNLQYDNNTNEWMMANEQFEVVGDANINLGNPAYTGKVDLFGWSNKSNEFGMSPSNEDIDYLGSLIDWGKTIGDGWFTLSNNEWDYLLNRRAGAAQKWAQAMVVDRTGFIILPDDWQLPEGVEFTPKYKVNEFGDVDFAKNKYNAADWAKMEAAGAIFLPAAGRRTGGFGNTNGSLNPHTGYNSWVYNFEYYGYYWSSSRHATKPNISYYVIFGYNSEGMLPQGVARWTEKGNYGQSVRLAKEALYTVTWLNEDGTPLEIDENVKYGATPSYDGATPTKEATAQYTYTFAAWSPAIEAVTGDVTYTATYTETENEYTVTFMNGDDVMQTSEWKYDQTPVYSGAVPAKDATAQYTYTFADWTPTIEAVKGDAVYEATFTATVNKYDIIFVNEDDTELQNSQWEYGQSPIYSYEIPTKADDAQYTYTFAGWDSEVKAVTGNATYKATFSAELRKYIIAFKNADGTLLQSAEVAYGETPAYTGTTPIKAADAEYTYTFDKWTPDVVAVEGEATYTATYKNVKNKYMITWLNEDGSLIEKTEVEHGSMPAHADMSKLPDAQYTYTFSGWTPALEIVTGVATYQATFATKLNEYTILFKNGEEVLQNSKFVYGATPVYNGAVPTKAADAQYTYTFDKWSPVVATVTGDATYEATFKQTTNSYTITWKNDDGSVIDVVEVAYGVVPTHADATKANAAQYTYAFKAWTPAPVAVDKDTTYTATYTSTVNKYAVVFKNGATELQNTEVAYGDVPAYAGETPTKAADAQYTYTFAGWSPAIESVTGPAVYEAAFTATVRNYAVTFKNGETVLQTGEWAYGQTPVYSGSTPTKDATAQYTYTFDKWTPTITAVTGEATYEATFKQTVIMYTVIFADEDGKVLQSEEMGYGATPIYSGETPTKSADAQYTYTFDKWTPDIAVVTANATYTATYKKAVNSYVVIFKNEDSTELQRSEWEYGSTPVYSGETPTKKADAQHTYTFAGWTPEISAVTGEATYTAQFTETAILYKVTWSLHEGDVTELMAYGVVPSAPVVGDYTLDGKVYTFDKWDKEIVAVTSDVTYTALYKAVERMYTVTFIVGPIHYSVEAAYGTLMSDIIDGALDEALSFYGFVKNADGQYQYTNGISVYTFTGWDKPIPEKVTEDATYTATYTVAPYEAIDEIKADDVPATKVMENGVLYIIRDGQKFSNTGRLVE